MVDDPVAAAAFAHTSDVVLAFDREGAVVRANAALATVLGLATAEALGERFWGVCGPGLATREACARAARGELALEALPREDVLLAADGTARWVTWTWARAGDGLVALARDVTDERRSRDARRKSEERFELASRAARDLIYDWDIVSGRLTWGQNALEVFGLRPEELGTSIEQWEARIHGDDLPRVSAKLAEAIERGTSYEDEYGFLRGGGGWVTVRDRGLVVTGADGRATRMIGCMEDVTEQRRAHLELAASEARYRFIAETTSDLIYDYDVVADVFPFVSPRVEHYVGVSASRLATEPGLWWRLMADDDRERVAGAFAADTAVRRPLVRYEYRLRRADGSWGEIHDAGAVIYDAAGRPIRVQGTVSDVGELRALQAELARAQKVESIGRLAGGIAHDFNNLLTGMVANLSLARLNVEQQPTRAGQHLDEVERAIDRASQLVRGLLAYSRQSTLSLEAVDLRECVDAVVRLLRPTLGPKIEVVVRAPPDLPRAWADAARIEQVLVNLALNARDAMQGGGALVISLDAVDVTAAGAPPDVRPGRFLRVVVEDDGVGMTPDVQARAFEPFFTTKADRGTGLGLAVVHGIVTQHAGWVECASEPGRGSRFVLHLPGAADDQLGAAVARPAERADPRGSEAVLVADDEPSIRRALRPLLEAFGFEVLVARDGQEAVEVFSREAYRVRAIVLDLTMPRLSGREALKLIRQVDPDVPVVVTTGYAVDGLAELPGVAAVVSKPYQPAELARTLRRVIDARATSGAVGAS
jgi:PAS domain S-box-containing protein